MADISKIQVHMEVIGSDNEHVGIVDYMEDEQTIRLTKSDRAAHGRHHLIPADWVRTVDEHVHLSKASTEVFRDWIAAA